MAKKYSKLSILLAAVLMLTMVLALAGCKETGAPVTSGSELLKALASEGTQTISVDEALVITEPLVVNGEKTIVGSGSITLNVTPAESDEQTSAPALLGCTKLTAKDLSGEAAALRVSSGAKLTLGGNVTIDGAGCGNGIVVLSGGTVTMTESATVRNGLGCGIYVCQDATLHVQSGNILTNGDHGVINMGTVNVTGGTLSGTETGAVIYSAGSLNISGGLIAEGGVHNIYVAAGSVTMTGGKLDQAEDDGLVVAAGASASVTGGTIENCGTHGLCNSGTMTTGEVTLIECGIANNATGKLDMNSTTVEISAVYCLANLGGTVNAKNFSALSCDTTSICNFAGDMTLENLKVEGSRAGCISNESGNLTVNGATLGVCREKPINVGSGVVRMDNITVEGTTGEYFGAYIYGGELYLSNASISYINYSALRADGDCYVELTNVTIDDTMASGIWARGGTIVGKNLTLTNVRGHAITNHGGKITIEGLTATDVGKNAILMNNGTTVLTDVSFVNVGDQGAYIQNGSLTVENGRFENIAQNGVYTVPGGESEVTLKNVNYSKIAKYGLNNGTKLTAENVTILETGEAGVLNKNVMSLKNVDIKFTVKDCLYNDEAGRLTVINTFLYSPGKSSNPVYNRGSIYAFNLNIQKSYNYGFRNKGYLTGNGLHIWDVAKVGLYNENGEVNQLNDLRINNTGDHAVNNKDGSFSATNLKLTNITGSKSNAIYNTGTMELGTVTIDGVVSHAVFNKGTITGSDFTISGAGEVGFNNNENAVADITNLIVTGSTHGAYNIAQMKLTNATFTDPSSNGIFNKGGELELHGTVTVTGSQGHGLCHNEGTVSGDANLIVKNISGNALYNAAGTVVIGDLTVDGAKYGISNKGKMVAGEVSITNCTEQGIHNADTLVVGGNATISNINGTTNGDNQGNGIYNTKSLTIEGDLSISDITSSGNTGNSSNNAIFNRGTLKVDGNVTIGNVKAGHAIIGTAGEINFPGTVTINGTVGKDNIIYFYSSAKKATFGNLVKTSNVAKVVLKVDGSTQVTVNSGTIQGGSGKDVVVSNGNALVTLNGVTITGGNNALHGAGGDIVANNVTISGCTIGINIRNANSEITVKGNSSITDASHGSSIHVNSKGKLTIEGNLTVSWSEGKTGKLNGVKIYNGSTLTLKGSGQLVITAPKTGISIDAGGILNGDAGSKLTITDVSAEGFAIENNGTITMNGTVTVSGAAGGNALVKAMNNTTIGTLNRADTTAREVLRAEKEAVVYVNGGTIQGGSGKDVIVASNTSVINLSNVSITGGNNMLYGAGGDIVATDVNLSGGSIAVNIRNANSEVTLKGTNTFSNTTHGTCMHINSKGKLTLAKDATLTLQWTEEALKNTKVGMKIYANSTFVMEDNSSLTMVDVSKGWNTESGHTFTRGTGATVTVNGTAA